MTLSVIIITKNEAAHIADCIASVRFADEIIVVDSGSTDGTRELAAGLGAKVTLTQDWPGFGRQKNRALVLATCDWVLSIDADERVTPELAQTIQQELVNPRAQAYKIARLSNFGGRWIRHSGWWPDHVLRLFKRGTARFKDVAVHESVQTSSAIVTLDSHFLHYPYADLETFIAKINHYSSEAAAMMHARGKTTSVLGATGHAVWTFIRIYLIRRGFLDGKEGFILAAMGAAGSFFRYNKLLLLQKDKINK
jgi:glycosyltransferase involved in cell wall biosynthesis